MEMPYNEMSRQMVTRKLNPTMTENSVLGANQIEVNSVEAASKIAVQKAPVSRREAAFKTEATCMFAVVVPQC